MSPINILKSSLANANTTENILTRQFLPVESTEPTRPFGQPLCLVAEEQLADSPEPTTSKTKGGARKKTTNPKSKE